MSNRTLLYEKLGTGIDFVKLQPNLDTLQLLRNLNQLELIVGTLVD